MIDDDDLPEGATLAATLQVPDEWMDDREIVGMDLLYQMDTPDGMALVVSLTFDDDSSVIGMTYPGGQRTVRLGRDSGWSVEERFRGRLLSDSTLDAPLLSMWSHVVEGVAMTSRQMREEEDEG